MEEAASQIQSSGAVIDNKAQKLSSLKFEGATPEAIAFADQLEAQVDAVQNKGLSPAELSANVKLIIETLSRLTPAEQQQFEDVIKQIAQMPHTPGDINPSLGKSGERPQLTMVPKPSGSSKAPPLTAPSPLRRAA